MTNQQTGDVILSTIKLVLSALLLPVAYAAVTAFYAHLKSGYPGFYDDQFLTGAGIFVFIFLFLYQFWGPYEFGQKVMAQVFRFAAPFERLTAHFFPFYVIVVLAGGYVVARLLGAGEALPSFIFTAGFVSAGHAVLLAQDLQNQSQSPLRPSYYFVYLLVLIVDVCLLVLLLDLTAGKFTFDAFMGSMARAIQAAYNHIWQLIF